MGAGIAGAHLLLSTGVAQAAQHDHTLSVPINIGPMILRVVLLVVVPAVAGFAVLRGFWWESSRGTAAAIASFAFIGVLFELMLAGALDFPPQVVVLAVALLAGPLFLNLSKDPRHEVVRRRLRVPAPWLVSAAAGFAFVEFVRVLLWSGDTARRVSVLHSGIVVALVGLSWFTVCGLSPRISGLLVRIEAAVLGNAVLAASAYAIMLSGLTAQ
ncbi:MAG: DUF6239 family natural product biosynthesis protein [Labedaea sp.]